MRDLDWSTGTAGGAGVAPCRETDRDRDHDRDHDHDRSRDRDRDYDHQYESRESATGWVGSLALCRAWRTG